MALVTKHLTLTLTYLTLSPRPTNPKPGLTLFQIPGKEHSATVGIMFESSAAYLPYISSGPDPPEGKAQGGDYVRVQATTLLLPRPPPMPVGHPPINLS